MTDFIEHSEALGRLKDELELLKAGNEIIAEHEQAAKSALDASHRLATANQELAERITLVADQLERTATTVQEQFGTLHSSAATTAQEYQSLLADLSQSDVVAKVTETESRLGEIQQVLIDKVLEIVGLLNAQAKTTAELQQQLFSLATPLQEQLANQERAIADAGLNTDERLTALTSTTNALQQNLEARITTLRNLLEAQSEHLKSAVAKGDSRSQSLDQQLVRIDKVSRDIQQDIGSQSLQMEQFQELIESQTLALKRVDDKVADRMESLVLRLEKSEAITLKTQQQIAGQREDIKSLSERLAESQRAQSDLRKQVESVRASARNSSSYAVITMVAQLGLLVLFILFLVSFVTRNTPF